MALIQGLTFSKKLLVPASNDADGPLVLDASSFGLTSPGSITSIAFPDVTTGFTIAFHENDDMVKPYASHLFGLRAFKVYLISTTTNPITDLQVIVTIAGQQTAVRGI